MTTTALTMAGAMITLSVKELALLQELRKVAWGQVTIQMADGEPDRIEFIREVKKL